MLKSETINGQDDVFVPRYHDSSFGHGVIGLANDSKLVEGNYQVALTDFAVGWMDSSNLAELIDFIAPRVPVTRRFEYLKWVNAEAFLSDASNDDLRAVGADFKRVEYTSTKAVGATDNRGLTVRLDRDQYNGSVSIEQAYTQRLIDRILRNRFRRAWTGLSAVSTSTGKTWDTTAGKDPDKDLQTELLTAATSVGIRPNRALYGDTAWDKRMLSTRAQNNAGGYDSVSLSLEQLAVRLGVGKVLIDRTRYQSGAAAKSEIVGANAIVFAGSDSPLPVDFSNAKCFVSNTDNGAPVRVFRKEEAKWVEITVETYDSVVITSSLGVRKLAIS